MGTAAEIRWGHENEDGEEEEGLRQNLAVMARGRHRFKLLEDRGWRCGFRLLLVSGFSILLMIPFVVSTNLRRLVDWRTVT